jgi:hypothetical protein
LLLLPTFLPAVVVAAGEHLLDALPHPLRFLAACYVGLGQMDQARSAIAQALRVAPESTFRRDTYGQVAYAGKRIGSVAPQLCAKQAARGADRLRQAASKVPETTA